MAHPVSQFSLYNQSYRRSGLPSYHLPRPTAFATFSAFSPSNWRNVRPQYPIRHRRDSFPGDPTEGGKGGEGGGNRGWQGGGSGQSGFLRRASPPGKWGHVRGATTSSAASPRRQILHFPHFAPSGSVDCPQNVPCLGKIKHVFPQPVVVLGADLGKLLVLAK